jgi:hypothetical protein
MTGVLAGPAPRTGVGGLRFWLAADVVVTGANAVVYLATAPLVADLLGATSGDVRLLGTFLLAFTAVVAISAARPTPSQTLARVVIAVNAAWTVASLGVVVTGAMGLNTVGSVWAVAQAAVVGGLAMLQYRSLS